MYLCKLRLHLDILVSCVEATCSDNSTRLWDLSAWPGSMGEPSTILWSMELTQDGWNKEGVIKTWMGFSTESWTGISGEGAIVGLVGLTSLILALYLPSWESTVLWRSQSFLMGECHESWRPGRKRGWSAYSEDGRWNFTWSGALAPATAA